MEMELIQPSEAPIVKKATSRTGKQSEELVAALVPGMVGKVTLPRTISVRGAKVSLTRAARRLGKELKLWDADGIVYMQLEE